MSLCQLLLLCRSRSREEDFELLRTYYTFEMSFTKFVLAEYILEPFAHDVIKELFQRLLGPEGTYKSLW